MLDLSQKRVIYRIFIPNIRNFYQQRIAQNIRRPGEIHGRKIPGFTQNLLPEKGITGKVGSVLHISVSLGSQIPYQEDRTSLCFACCWQELTLIPTAFHLGSCVEPCGLQHARTSPKKAGQTKERDREERELSNLTALSFLL